MALSKPQRDLLLSISEKSATVSPSYAPAKALVMLGYAEWVPHRFSDHLTITVIGREALKDKK